MATPTGEMSSDVGGGIGATSDVATTTAQETSAGYTGAAALSPSSSNVVLEVSPQDTDREYRPLVLENDMHCLLISDATTDRSSAAMDVRVGHLSDDIAGLAHFLEHMLFLGTEKYPDENSYNAYLNKHGGSSNAFTDMESTSYFFDVASGYLEGALDHFAQFFIAPLFTADATDRELQAVDSEHAKNLQSDVWRSFQLSKSLCRVDHPFHKFGTGNLETLSGSSTTEDLRQALLAFYARHYSANRMKLVVLGKESLDELETWVRRCFGPVVNKGLPPNVFPGTPYGPPQLTRRVNVVPVQQTRSVELFFPLPEILSHYRSKPLRVLSHLLGHESRGSILALLRQWGWANALGAGETHSCSDWSAFCITIELTEAGLQNVYEVVQVVFQYLGLLRGLPGGVLPRWIYDEISNVAATNFRFQSKRNPMEYTCEVAGQMQLYPPEHYLSGRFLFYEFAPNLIADFLQRLTPDNMLLFVQSKSFVGSTTETEPWYQTPYHAEPLPPDRLQLWWAALQHDEAGGGNSELHLPERNDMIPTDFSLRPISPDFPLDAPVLLRDDATCRCWYKPDNVFGMPKMSVQILLKTSAVGCDNPTSWVLSALWVSIWQEHATDFLYLASMGGLVCHLQATATGIGLVVSGYNHKLGTFLKRIVLAICSLPQNLTEDLFDRMHDKLAKDQQSFLVAAPYRHGIYGADVVLEQCYFSISERMTALEEVHLEDVLTHSYRLLKTFHLEMLVHGNATPDEALGLAQLLLDGLNPLQALPLDLPHLRVVDLPCAEPTVYELPAWNAEETNHCATVVLPMGAMDLRTNSILALLHHVMKEPAFYELRTQEQLGYIVHTSVKTLGHNIKALLFLIQSDSYTPDYLEQRIDAFLQSFRTETLVPMTKDEFQNHVRAVTETFREKNKNMWEESTKYWHVITNETYMFRRLPLIANHVEQLTKQDVLRFFDRFVAPESPFRRKLSVRVQAPAAAVAPESTPKATVVRLSSDAQVAEFKRTRPLLPLPAKVDVSEHWIGERGGGVGGGGLQGQEEKKQQDKNDAGE